MEKCLLVSASSVSKNTRCSTSIRKGTPPSRKSPAFSPASYAHFLKKPRTYRAQTVSLTIRSGTGTPFTFIGTLPEKKIKEPSLANPYTLEFQKTRDVIAKFSRKRSRSFQRSNLAVALLMYRTVIQNCQLTQVFSVLVFVLGQLRRFYKFPTYLGL